MIDRLTYYDESGGACFRWNKPSGNVVIVNAATFRLAAYEDTGFLPADIEVMSRAHTALRDMKKKLLAELAQIKAERDAAVEDLTRLANGYKDCGNCIHIGDSIGKCEYKHTGDCFDWRGLEAGE